MNLQTSHGDLSMRDYTFGDILAPFPYDESININNLMTNINDANMVAIKIGDVNGSTSAQWKNSALGISTRSNPIEKLILEKVSINGSTYIEFRSNKNGLLYGFQFGARLNGLNLEALQNGVLDITPEMVVNTSGKMRVSWSENNGIKVNKDDVLFRIKVDAANAKSFLLPAENDIVTPEIYFNTLEVRDLEFEWRNIEEDINEFRLDQNEPNPFIDDTEIGFYMPKRGEATFTVYSVDGKVMYELTDNYETGENTIVVKAEDVGVNGMVIYEVKGNGFVGNGRMILVK